MNQIFTLKTCDSCRKATKWLRDHSIPFEEIPIRDQAPSSTQLANALHFLNGDIHKLFNTSGQDYRALNIKEKLPSLSHEDAISLLSSNGNLIKRPFFVSEKITLIGFNESLWKSALL